jgi:hypothetical protein
MIPPSSSVSLDIAVPNVLPQFLQDTKRGKTSSGSVSRDGDVFWTDDPGVGIAT